MGFLLEKTDSNIKGLSDSARCWIHAMESLHDLESSSLDILYLEGFFVEPGVH